MNVHNVDTKRGIIQVVAYRAPDGSFSFLMLMELKDKPAYFKFAGMLSFPAETAKEFEHPHETVKRLGREELGRELGNYSGPLSIQEFPHRVRLAVVVSVVPESFRAEPTDTDVAHYDWVSEDQLREHIKQPGVCRIETEAALEVAMQLVMGGVYA